MQRQWLHASVRMAGLVLLLAGGSAMALGQDRTLAEDEFYPDVKQALMNHYHGKVIRAKLAFPATRRGLEMVDGALQNRAEKDPPPPLAEPGDELTIKSFRVNDKNIEVLLARNEAPAKRRMPNPFSPQRQPRIHMRFTTELRSRDLTIDNINRMLDQAVDVTPLLQAPTDAAPAAVLAGAAMKAETGASLQTMPTPEIVGDLPGADPRLSEVTIECPTANARVYVDGSYSGFAPRTIRLRAGMHTILVIKDGFANWEQRLYIPGAKRALVRAELTR
jgi:PEGA domain